MGEGDAAKMLEDYRRGLEEDRPQARAFAGTSGNKFTVDWSRHINGDWSEQVTTAVDRKRLDALAKTLTKPPAGFTLHPRVGRIIDDRARMYADELPLDWGAAETMAYATLLSDGYDVRITGQDTARGTFFHRHSVLHDQASGKTDIPLARVAKDRARFRVIDSTLSEEAVLGFEYGYSTTDPSTLVIWEGQFGDFVNGAQVVIDQFITSGEAKWGRVSGITLFLPHGYEGQGPEHSSARLERFLQLSAELNHQVCVPSTPAQMFHMLRRQMLRALRKPLVVMTPKSLLRHKLSVSVMADLSEGRFQPVIDEIDKLKADAVRRIVFCGGKVYFDLLERRRAEKIADVALVRIEELYPFPADDYQAILDRYSKAREIVWCQEEPQNQGAWYQIRHRLQAPLAEARTLASAGREGAAAPATGLHAIHQREQEALVADALTGKKS
jgi:2-oxoglutarate dehydrogenase E1 component